MNGWRSWILDRRLLIISGILIGIGLGLIAGWMVWPVTYTDTDVYDLRSDYQDEFVVMVGALYSLDGNIDAARQTLALVSDPDVPRPVESIVIDVAERYIARGTDPVSIGYLVKLAQGLNSLTTAMELYILGQ